MNLQKKMKDNGTLLTGILMLVSIIFSIIFIILYYKWFNNYIFFAKYIMPLVPAVLILLYASAFFETDKLQFLFPVAIGIDFVGYILKALDYEKAGYFAYTIGKIGLAISITTYIVVLLTYFKAIKEKKFVQTVIAARLIFAVVALVNRITFHMKYGTDVELFFDYIEQYVLYFLMEVPYYVGILLLIPFVLSHTKKEKYETSL